MNILLLLGPSSAGKTTICDQLKSQHKWIVFSIDQVTDTIHMEAAEGLLEVLTKQDLISKLSMYMTEKEVLQLCQNGLLNISIGAHTVHNHQFPNPNFPGLDELLLAKGFSNEESQSISKLLRAVGQVHETYQYPDALTRLFDDALNPAHGADASVVIDIVPGTHSDANQLLDAFNKRVTEFKMANGEESIHAFSILAYCPPQHLSERILKRNTEADISGDLRNKRQGLFPFQQLSVLVTADNSNNPEQQSLGNVSRDELMRIAYQHRRPIAPTGKPSFKEAVTAVIEYGRLANKFGMRSDDNHAKLGTRSGLKFDAIINTAEAEPAKLAQQLVDATTSKVNYKKNI